MIFKKIIEPKRKEDIIEKFKSLRITGRMEENGANTHYRLSDGSIVTRQFAVDMYKLGYLQRYQIYKSKYGVEYLRDKKDNDINDNIDEQPLFTFKVTELPEKK